MIDVGINRVPASEKGATRLIGDVAFDEVLRHAGAITPVLGRRRPDDHRLPLRNTLVAAHRLNNIPSIPPGFA